MAEISHGVAAVLSCLKGGDFLSSSDLTFEQVAALLDLASQLKNGDRRIDLGNRVLGLIFTKASTRTRVSFQVTSKIDSRTILGEQGAEQLLGQGDMLYMAGGGQVTRVHGPLVSDQEVENIVKFLKEQGDPQYVVDITADVYGDTPTLNNDGSGSSDNSYYDQAVALVSREGKASTSFIQRHLQIGYNRAARIIEQMEEQGVVTKADRVGRREVLVANH